MPAKPKVDALLKKHLGKDVADVMLAKIDKMIQAGKTAAEIEKVVTADLVAHIEKEVTAAVIAKIGPITPIKVKPIQTDIKSKIGPISVSVKMIPPIQVKVPQVKVPKVTVGPGPITRGSK
jgi:hypothetical protein